MTEAIRRCECLSLIAIVDNRHTLRLLPDGTLGLLHDPKGRKGREYECKVVATAPATRREAIAFALRIHRDHTKLTPGFLNAVRLRLGDTPSQSLDIAAEYFGLS